MAEAHPLCRVCCLACLVWGGGAKSWHSWGDRASQGTWATIIQLLLGASLYQARNPFWWALDQPSWAKRRIHITSSLQWTRVWSLEKFNSIVALNIFLTPPLLSSPKPYYSYITLHNFYRWWKSSLKSSLSTNFVNRVWPVFVVCILPLSGFYRRNRYWWFRKCGVS